MTRMKSWESPRRGHRRNNKSKAATARLRQIKKRNKRLLNKLRSSSQSNSSEKYIAPKTPPGLALEGFLFDHSAA